MPMAGTVVSRAWATWELTGCPCRNNSPVKSGTFPSGSWLTLRWRASSGVGPPGRPRGVDHVGRVVAGDGDLEVTVVLGEERLPHHRRAGVSAVVAITRRLPVAAAAFCRPGRAPQLPSSAAGAACCPRPRSSGAARYIGRITQNPPAFCTPRYA
jgi:hypothetical protein